MDRRLIWTERASSDIEAIVRYIARRDPKASGSIGLGIYQRAQILDDVIVVGRVWPAAKGDADLTTPLE